MEPLSSSKRSGSMRPRWTSLTLLLSCLSFVLPLLPLDLCSHLVPLISQPNRLGYVWNPTQHLAFIHLQQLIFKFRSQFLLLMLNFLQLQRHFTPFSLRFHLNHLLQSLHLRLEFSLAFLHFFGCLTADYLEIHLY